MMSTDVSPQSVDEFGQTQYQAQDEAPGQGPVPMAMSAQLHEPSTDSRAPKDFRRRSVSSREESARDRNARIF